MLNKIYYHLQLLGRLSSLCDGFMECVMVTPYAQIWSPLPIYFFPPSIRSPGRTAPVVLAEALAAIAVRGAFLHLPTFVLGSPRFIMMHCLGGRALLWSRALELLRNPVLLVGLARKAYIQWTDLAVANIFHL